MLSISGLLGSWRGPTTAYARDWSNATAWSLFCFTDTSYVSFLQVTGWIFQSQRLNEAPLSMCGELGEARNWDWRSEADGSTPQVYSYTKLYIYNELLSNCCFFDGISAIFSHFDYWQGLLDLWWCRWCGSSIPSIRLQKTYVLSYLGAASLQVPQQPWLHLFQGQAGCPSM